MKDILTPRERFGLLIIDEKPDRCNVIPLITSHAAIVAGVSVKKYYTQGEVMARAQLAAIEEYGHDAISIFSEVGILAEAMGSKFEYPEDDLPIFREPALGKAGPETLSTPNPTQTGRLPVYLEAIRCAYDAVGDTIPVLAYVPAPFTTGMMLCQPEQFLIDLARNPARVDAIMQKALDAAIEFCYEIINAGGLPVLVDPLASGSVISPATYRKFALPYEAELIKFLHRYDLDIILHICGDTRPIVDILPETGADLMSFDHLGIDVALERLSGRMRLIGNFDTSRLVLSSADVIGREVGAMVAGAKEAGRGYVASTGCEVPLCAPRDNVLAFVKAAKEAGAY